jgi:hypothetical protein
MSIQHCGQICDLTLGQAGFPLALALAMVAKPYTNKKQNNFDTVFHNPQISANTLCTQHDTNNIREFEINKV